MSNRVVFYAAKAQIRHVDDLTIRSVDTRGRSSLVPSCYALPLAQKSALRARRISSHIFPCSFTPEADASACGIGTRNWRPRIDRVASVWVELQTALAGMLREDLLHLLLLRLLLLLSVSRVWFSVALGGARPRFRVHRALRVSLDAVGDETGADQRRLGFLSPNRAMWRIVSS